MVRLFAICAATFVLIFIAALYLARWLRLRASLPPITFTTEVVEDSNPVEHPPLPWWRTVFEYWWSGGSLIEALSLFE